jgi:hypothetical protein
MASATRNRARNTAPFRNTHDNRQMREGESVSRLSEGLEPMHVGGQNRK